MALPAYAQTSKFRGCSFGKSSTLRQAYRRAAERMHEAYERLVFLHAAGKDIFDARVEYEMFTANFWNLDHNARRYVWFYRAASQRREGSAKRER